MARNLVPVTRINIQGILYQTKKNEVFISTLMIKISSLQPKLTMLREWRRKLILPWPHCGNACNQRPHRSTAPLSCISSYNASNCSTQSPNIRQKPGTWFVVKTTTKGIETHPYWPAPNSILASIIRAISQIFNKEAIYWNPRSENNQEEKDLSNETRPGD